MDALLDVGQQHGKGHDQQHDAGEDLHGVGLAHDLFQGVQIDAGEGDGGHVAHGLRHDQ